MLPVDEQSHLSGLIISKHRVIDAASKQKATSSLGGWQSVEMTPKKWIEALSRGHTIQPSDYSPLPDGTFTHKIPQWNSTHFVFADGDRFAGIETENDGTKKNPDGIPYWTAEKGLGKQFPELKHKVYSVGQSVSSMSDDKPPAHRRYRLIFLFDKPIKTVEHYNQILLALANEFPIIAPVKRPATQPVFGNARKGFNGFSTCGNILSLDDYPFQPTQPPEMPQGASKDSRPDLTLLEYLNKHDIAHTPSPKHGRKYFLDCPNKSSHTGGKQNDTAAYVFDDGKWAFHCSHDYCQEHDLSTWEAFKRGYNIKDSEFTERKPPAAAAPVPEEKPKKEKFNAVDFGDSLMADKRYWFTQGFIHRYNATTGVYDNCESELRKECRQGIGRVSTSHHVSEVESYIKDMTFEGEQSPGVCLANGVFDFKTTTLQSHSPDNYFLKSYPVAYDAKAHCPDFDSWLCQVLPDEQCQSLIYEMIGSIFDPNSNEYQTAFLLSGSGSNGKSTLLDIIEKLVGETNISQTSFHEFGVTPYAVAELVNMALALDDDVSTTKPLSSTIKPLITKKRHVCEKKYINRYEFDMTATFVGAINGAINTVDKTSAFWRRWCVIPFSQVFPKDANFKRDLMSHCTSPEALSGILNTSLLAYERVLERGEFSIPESSERLVEMMRMDSNHVRYFIEDCLSEDASAKVLVSDVWDAYKTWAEREQISKMFSQPKCYQTIEETKGVYRKQAKINGKVLRYFFGVKLV